MDISSSNDDSFFISKETREKGLLPFSLLCFFIITITFVTSTQRVWVN